MRKFPELPSISRKRLLGYTLLLFAIQLPVALIFPLPLEEKPHVFDFVTDPTSLVVMALIFIPAVLTEDLLIRWLPAKIGRVVFKIQDKKILVVIMAIIAGLIHQPNISHACIGSKLNYFIIQFVGGLYLGGIFQYECFLLSFLVHLLFDLICSASVVVRVFL